MLNIVYYITGHGFGHARRSSEILRHLLPLRPGLTIHLRTTAPAAIFAEDASPNIHLHPLSLDPGAIEKDLFTIDIPATLSAVRNSLRDRDSIIERELLFLKNQHIDLILTDIPFLAGDIAAAARIPIIAITNFTWDWIYEPYFTEHADLLAEIQNSYKKIPTLLKIPFGGRTDWFSEVIDIPLIAPAPRQSRIQVLSHLQLDPQKPKIVLSLRGGLAPESLITAAASAPDYLFLTPSPTPPNAPKNLLHIPLGPLTFTDLLSISSAVVSKLGYGIVADCLAARLPILYPWRSGFREDEVTLKEAAQSIPLQEIPHADFFSGNWKPHLDRLLKMSMPRQILPTNGAPIAAQIISSRL